MTKYRIRGGHEQRLSGDLRVQGAKNAALPILAAAVLTEGKNEIHNVPHITDVLETLEILKNIGCRAEFKNGIVTIDFSGTLQHQIPDALAQKMRSSILFLGAMLGRMGKIDIALPGGCKLGERAIDLHIDGLRAMGAEIIEEEGKLYCRTDGLKGAHIKLHTASVGATENLMLAAVRAEGQTIIENASCEPEVADLAKFLVSCGAKIFGVSTGMIIIQGVKTLRSGKPHTVMPDRIVAGTYLLATAMTGGSVTLHDVYPNDLMPITSVLAKMGCVIHGGRNCVTLAAPERLKAVAKVTTDIHPGFPTDLQPQLTAALAIAKGTSEINETIFESRFSHCEALNKMGADINVSACKRIFVVHGKETLQAANVTATDLRCGAALVLAGLVAEGETVVDCAEYVQRGYVDMAGDLNSLGADVV